MTPTVASVPPTESVTALLAWVTGGAVLIAVTVFGFWLHDRNSERDALRDDNKRLRGEKHDQAERLGDRIDRAERRATLAEQGRADDARRSAEAAARHMTPEQAASAEQWREFPSAVIRVAEVIQAGLAAPNSLPPRRPDGRYELKPDAEKTPEQVLLVPPRRR